MKKSFTLIELMIVIAILGILASLISGNFITSLKKGRDARRKTDLEQIQRALEMYYEDNKAYPLPGAAQGQLNLTTAGRPLCHPTLACDTTGKVYMFKLPSSPSGANYVYLSTGSDYQLYACLENNLQVITNVSTGYGSSFTSTNCRQCKDSANNNILCVWGISSSNISP